ncbi:MAG: hypothetical protein ACREJM_06030 [Candidatus Saccharimonadales bacterium]
MTGEIEREVLEAAKVMDVKAVDHRETRQARRPTMRVQAKPLLSGNLLRQLHALRTSLASLALRVELATALGAAARFGLQLAASTGTGLHDGFQARSVVDWAFGRIDHLRGPAKPGGKKLHFVAAADCAIFRR